MSSTGNPSVPPPPGFLQPPPARSNRGWWRKALVLGGLLAIVSVVVGCCSAIKKYRLNKATSTLGAGATTPLPDKVVEVALAQENDKTNKVVKPSTSTTVHKIVQPTGGTVSVSGQPAVSISLHDNSKIGDNVTFNFGVGSAPTITADGQDVVIATPPKPEWPTDFKPDQTLNIIDGDLPPRTDFLATTGVIPVGSDIQWTTKKGVRSVPKVEGVKHVDHEVAYLIDEGGGKLRWIPPEESSDRHHTLAVRTKSLTKDRDLKVLFLNKPEGN